VRWDEVSEEVSGQEKWSVTDWCPLRFIYGGLTMHVLRPLLTAACIIAFAAPALPSRTATAALTRVAMIGSVSPAAQQLAVALGISDDRLIPTSGR
jgi:hypothetical protein